MCISDNQVLVQEYSNIDSDNYLTSFAISLALLCGSQIAVIPESKVG